MIKGYKYRIYPTKVQKQLINQMIGNARFIYNWALQKRIEAYQKDKTSLSAFDIIQCLPKLKKQKEFEWLGISNAQSLQLSVINMEKAFTKFFKQKTGFPKFKQKKNKQTVSFPQNTKINFEINKVQIVKIGWIRVEIDRQFIGKVKTTTISKTPTNKYFISLLVESDVSIPKQKSIKSKTAIGIDTGIKTFATLSNGTKIENPKYLEQTLIHLKFLHRQVSKKVKGSNNRRKAILRLATCYEYTTNQREDFLHKLTTEIANQYDTVIVENLNIAGMLKNHKLARSISSLGLGKFYQYLQYKLKDKGKNYIEIGRFEPSSKMCSCGKINQNLTLFDRTWTCIYCSITHDRDILAANNIKRFGLQKQNLINAVGITV